MSVHDLSEPTDPEALSEQAKKLDLLTLEISGINELMKEFLKRGSGQTQTIIHKTAGMGAWAAAAVTACFFTVAMLIAELIWLVPIIHDHDAYIHKYGALISKLEEQKK